MSCGHMCVSAGSRKIFNPDGGRRRGLLQPQLQTCRPSCKIAIEEYIGGTRRQILWRYRTVCTIPCVGPVDHAEEQHCIDIRVTVTRRFGTHILKSIANEGDQLSLLGDDLLAVRSEEHTSELQSLMRISYAVFCLKKKHNNKK